MANFSRHLASISIGTALLAAGSVSALAQETGRPDTKEGFSAISASFNYPMPLGDAYQTFLPRGGFDATARLSGSLGRNIDLIASTGYRLMSVRNLETARIHQFPIYVGIETRPTNIDYWLRPYTSMEVGGIYSSLDFQNSANLIQNAAVSFAFRIRPGLNIPLFSGISLNAELPYEVIASRNLYTAVGAIIGMRYDL